MVEYINQILIPYVKGRPALLLLDEFSAHIHADVIKVLSDNNIKTCFIPGGYTSYLQMCDTHVNATIKRVYKEEWSKFISDGIAGQTVNGEPVRMTNGGNRAKPTYENIAQWCSKGLRAVARTTVVKSFPQCGIYYNRNEFNALSFVQNLNSRLKSLLFINDHGVVYNQFMDLIQLIILNFETPSALLDSQNKYVKNWKRFVKKRFVKNQETEEIEFIEIGPEGFEPTEQELVFHSMLHLNPIESSQPENDHGI
jgi:hypothetical protein